METTFTKLDDKNYQEVKKEGEKIIAVQDLNQDDLIAKKALYESLDGLELNNGQIQEIVKWFSQLRNMRQGGKIQSWPEYVSARLDSVNEKLKVFKK